MTQELARAVRTRFGARAPRRYLQFLAQEQYEELEYLELRSGFVEGWYLPDFTDYRRLWDVDQLARYAGIDALTSMVWSGEFGDFFPLALLEPVDERESRSDVGAFLAIGLQPASCPVYVFVREGWMLVPLAASLDAFIRGEAWRGGTPFPHRRLGHAYDAFGWSRAPQRGVPALMRARA